MGDFAAKDLYDKYSNNEIDRRQFMEKLALVAGGVAAAYGLCYISQTPGRQ